MPKRVLLMPFMLFCFQSAIIIKLVTITSNVQTMLIPYIYTFKVVPSFSFYIQSGTISSPQFSLTYLANQTKLTKTYINITFLTWVDANQFTNGGFLNVQVLVTDQADYSVNFGIVPLDVSASTLTFTGFSLSYTNSRMQIYPLTFPMSYVKIENSSTLAKNQIALFIDNQPDTLMVQGKVFFSYIYFNNVYAANKIIALYQGFDQSNNSYEFSYASFAFQPSSKTLLMTISTYISINVPFFSLSTAKMLASSGTPIDNFSVAYMATDWGIFYTADAFFFSNSFTGCPTGEYLYYLVYFSTLPYSCIPCAASCLTCFPPDPLQPDVSDSNSCLSCPKTRSLNVTSNYNIQYGSCPCSAGMQQKDGVCYQCSINCLSFQVVYIETTNQSNFLLYFSYPTIVEKVSIDQNLVVTINGGGPLNYTYQQSNIAIYTIGLTLDEMAPCQETTCSITFQYTQPQYILNAEQTKSLSNAQVTIHVQNFVNYYNQLPAQLQKAFEVLGMVMLGTYTSGYTSLFKILFQLEQFIDAHKYLNLTLPIIYNQLVEQLQNFKFMDLTYLMPQQIRNQLTSFIPSDLDQLGSPRLIYYEQGVNYAKNIITGFISVAFMLLLNYLIYLLLNLTPLKLTKILAKKISKRKIITIHDNFDQLVFPVFFYSMNNFQYFLLHPQLYWVYAAAALTGFISLSAPFLVVAYVYLNRKNQQKVDIFQDLLQDNTMSQPVTYVYYILNYYRKIFFGLCLTDTLPGLIQIYLLICLNSVHLAFQVYLIAAKTYKSKSKVVVRLINSICVIAVEVLIMVYNLSWYDKQTMINIGLSCFYLSITTALLNIIDAFIKLFDTIFQEINQKKIVPTEPEMFKPTPMLQQFSKQIICNLGQELKPPPVAKDHRQTKFQEDKELMQQTFNREDYMSDLSDQISDAVADRSQAEELNLVYIDEDWTNVFPIESDSHNVTDQLRNESTRKISVNLPEQSKNDLYQIPEEINLEVDKISKERNFRKQGKSRKTSKYQPSLKPSESIGRRTAGHAKINTLQIKPARPTKIQEEQISQLS